MSNKIGVKTIPINDPKAELKIAAASLPPTAFVKITAEETGGGIQETTVNPPIRKGSKEVIDKSNFVRKKIYIGTKTNVNP